ncbi:MAG TPA: membrane bound O-acyl transferase family-domain-containing protein [Planctomycetota bacterium]|nr:membrane bound O-acyl transferase family-domain-containing protein [Planctomycetota bacterium]
MMRGDTPFALSEGSLRANGWARLAGWALVIVAALGSERLTSDATPLVRMVAIIGATLMALKVLVTLEEGVHLTTTQWLAFASYPGMRPSAFAHLSLPPRSGGRVGVGGNLFTRGVIRLAVGLALYVVARALATWSLVAATLVLMPALSLILHFGIFNLASAFWARAGADTGPLFKAPLLATSLGEFWGRRWNLAFSEMTALCVYRPLRETLGRHAALLASFVFSGLLHELAISVPVRAGYGLPTLYFLLHGALVTAERTAGLKSRLWTLGWLAVPLPLLFHPPFVRGVLWALLDLRSP